MSDQQRQGEGYESLDDLFDEQLTTDLLGGGGATTSRNLEPDPPPRQQPAPQPRKISDGGYGPLIAAKEKEIAALEKKVEGFRSNDSAYIYTDEAGEKQFDHSQHRADEITLGRLSRELNTLVRRRDEAMRNAENQGRNAYRLAKRLLEERVKKLPQKYHAPVVKMFGTYFKQFDEEGYWGRREMQEMQNLTSALADMLDTVVGRVFREEFDGRGQEPAPTRDMSSDDYDEEDTSESDDEDEDDVTRGIMYAYNQRKAGRGKTIGQIRREQAAKKQREREQQ